MLFKRLDAFVAAVNKRRKQKRKRERVVVFTMHYSSLVCMLALSLGESPTNAISGHSQPRYRTDVLNKYKFVREEIVLYSNKPSINGAYLRKKFVFCLYYVFFMFSVCIMVLNNCKCTSHWRSFSFKSLLNP